jgi:hypothetical protein
MGVLLAVSVLVAVVRDATGWAAALQFRPLLAAQLGDHKAA